MPNLADLEFSVLQAGKCPVQEDVHTPQRDGKIDTHFCDDQVPVTWYSHGDLLLEQNKIKDNEVRYAFRGDVSFLSKMQLQAYLPPVRVRTSHIGEYKVCYGSYVGIAVIEQTVLNIDGATPTVLPGIYYNIPSQFFRKNNSDAEIRREKQRLGHVPELLEWSDELPGYHIRVNQPFFFASADHDALPVNLGGKNHMPNSVVQVITFRNQMSQLLRMQQKTDNGWRDLTTKEVEEHMYVLDCPAAIQTPEIRGWYSVNTNEELDQYRCKKTGTYDRYYVDVLHSTESCLTRKPYHNLDECTMPVRSLFWGLQNVTAAKHNDYNNFTTSRDQIDFKQWPIDTNTLSYGTKSHRFKDMPVDYFLDNHRFPSDPMDVGLLGYGIGVKPTHRMDVGVALSYLKGRLQVDMSPAAGRDLDFDLHVFCHVQRKLVLRKNTAGEYKAEVSQETASLV